MKYSKYLNYGNVIFSFDKLYIGYDYINIGLEGDYTAHIKIECSELKFEESIKVLDDFKIVNFTLN